MIKRKLNLLTFLDKKRSLFIFGARGTGKTVLLNQDLAQTKNLTRIDLLRGNDFQRYIVEPGLFGQEIRAQMRQADEWIYAVDEVQRVPELLNEVHAAIEEFKGRIAFVLTGSSARKLKRGGANLLAGRAITKFLHPLSITETSIDLDRALQFGTLPGIYCSHEDEIASLESYVSTYLQEEIQQEALVRAIDKFTRFLDFAGQLNGEPINFRKLGQQSGISGPTAQEYFSILTDTMLAKMLPGWSHSVKKQLLQAPKFYFFDCGVLNAINGELRTALKPSSFRFGRLFETYVIQEIVRTNDYFSLGFRLFYWRDKNGREVDVVVAQNIATPRLAIEIKSHTQPGPEDCIGLNAFAEDYPKISRWCICRTPRPYDVEGIHFLPWQEAVFILSRGKI